MDRTFVVAIQLNLFWDTLLFYENAHANGINRLRFLRRRNLPHPYGGCHNYPLEIKELIRIERLHFSCWRAIGNDRSITSRCEPSCL